MATSCDTEDLAEAAKCFCFSEKQQLAVQTYLLTQIAGSAATPNELLDAAKCFQCMSVKDLLAIQNYLLCQMANQ
jgi:hypothetical protein